MAALRKSWFTGRSITAITITPLTLSVDNVTLTPGTTYDLAGTLEEMNQDYTAEVEMIQALDKIIANNVIVTRSNSFRIRQIMENTSPGTRLGDIAAQFDFVMVVETRAGKTYTYYGVIVGYSEPLVRGKHVAELVLAQIDLGATANPAYT